MASKGRMPPRAADADTCADSDSNVCRQNVPNGQQGGCMYSSMDHVPWDADEGTWANTCQGGSTGVLMTLPTGWFIAQDDAQARDVIKRSWFATTCMLVGRDSGRGYFTRAHTDAHAAGSDCGHSQILSNEGDASCGSYVPSQGCQYAVKNFPMRILIAKAQQVSCCGMYRRG